MTPEELIKAGKRKAKWGDELNRRAEAREAIDFYNYRQEEALTHDINERYPDESEDIQRYRFTAPITQSLVNQLAVCFKKSPVIVLPSAPKATQDAFVLLLDSSKFYKTLKQVDKYTELTGKVAVIPRYNAKRKQVCLDICTPDKCFVRNSANAPTEASEFGYTIGQTEDPHLTEQMNIYAVWTDELYREVEINRDGVETKEILSKVNPYKRIPVAWFEINQPLDSFWLDAGNPLIALNRRINMQITNLDIGIDFQSFSTMVTTGLDEEKSIPVGVTRRINIPHDQTTGKVEGDAKYITPTAQLLEVWQIIQEGIRWFAGIMGISVDSISQGSNFTSGFQLKLSKAGVQDRNNDKQDMYREPIRELCQLVMDCETIYGSTNFPPDASINVDFADIQIEVDPLVSEQVKAAKIANGTLDAVGCLMLDNPDLTVEEAEKQIAQIEERKAKFRPKALPIDLTNKNNPENPITEDDKEQE